MRRLSEARLVFLGIVLSLVFWFLEGLLHVLVFHQVDLAEEMFSPQLHEVWMRLVVMAMFVAFGIYAQWLLNARHRAEESARAVSAELHQIFETAADGMRVVDRDFTVLRANQTFAAMAGMQKRDIVGSKCYEVFRGELCDTRGCPMIRILDGEERVDYDAEKVRTDHKIVPCMVTATPFRRPDGELIGIVEDFKDISERRRSEQELMASQQRLRELARHLQVVREEERRRIAREIHDELGQALTALNMDLHWLGRQLPRASQEIETKLRSMLGLIATTIASVRRICTELRPSILDDLGLTAAVEWQAEEFSKRTGIPCELNTDPGELELDQDLSVAVFRIFQETLTNVTRHAEARRVRIDLLLRDASLELCVCDDGRGMVGGYEGQRQSFGLIGIRERVRDFGGELRIVSVPREGTRIEVRIPLGNGGGS